LSEQIEISVVDDDASVREGLVSLMQSHGYITEAFQSGADFLASRRQPRCLIVDMHMPGMTGLELGERLASAGRSIPTILITARPDEGVRARALQAGVLCYLTKPFSEDQLLECIGEALGRGHQHAEGA
jgi:FixJ family two-component response regulator